MASQDTTERGKSAEQQQRLYEEQKQIFDIFDEDHNGTICATELRSAMKLLGDDLSEEEVKKLIEAEDMDGDGSTLNFEEFQRFLSKRQPKTPEDKMKRIFKICDRDGNGSITAEELRSTMKRLGLKITEEDFQNLLAKADTDNDGEINYDEFVKAFPSGLL
ncbi:calmodulin-like 3 [Mactra antiquata]